MLSKLSHLFGRSTAPSALSARESLESKNGFLDLFALRAQIKKHLDDVHLGSESSRVPVGLPQGTSGQNLACEGALSTCVGIRLPSNYIVATHSTAASS